jgi:hypothetical protein
LEGEETIMEQSTNRILTTHAGSLPRPNDLARMMYGVLDEKPSAKSALSPAPIAASEPSSVITPATRRQHG